MSLSATSFDTSQGLTFAQTQQELTSLDGGCVVPTPMQLAWGGGGGGGGACLARWPEHADANVLTTRC